MISPLEAKDLVVGCQSFALHLVLSKRLPALPLVVVDGIMEQARLKSGIQGRIQASG